MSHQTRGMRAELDTVSESRVWMSERVSLTFVPWPFSRFDLLLSPRLHCSCKWHAPCRWRNQKHFTPRLPILHTEKRSVRPPVPKGFWMLNKNTCNNRCLYFSSGALGRQQSLLTRGVCARHFPFKRANSDTWPFDPAGQLCTPDLDPWCMLGPYDSKQFVAYGRRKWVIQLSFPAHAVQISEGLWRKLYVNNCCGIWVSGN